MKGNRNVGGCPSGRGGGETKSPKERYDLIFLSISPEPKKCIQSQTVKQKKVRV
jgi:hypothetical protein